MSAAAGRLATRFGSWSFRTAKCGLVYSKNRLQSFYPYFRTELAPPGPTEWGQVVAGFKQLSQSTMTGKWRSTTVKDAARNTLVTVEVLLWFYIGECIGKRRLVGYDINLPHTKHHHGFSL